MSDTDPATFDLILETVSRLQDLARDMVDRGVAVPFEMEERLNEVEQIALEMKAAEAEAFLVKA